MADFTAILVTDTITAGQSTKTLTSGVDYTLPSGVSDSDCYVYFSNCPITGRGKSSGGGNQNLNDITCWLDADGFVANGSFDVIRADTTNDCGFSLYIVCWTGPVAGPSRVTNLVSEIIIFVSPQTEVTSANFTVTDPNKVMVLIAGQGNDQSGRTRPGASMFTADAISQVSGTTYNVTIRRGDQAQPGQWDMASIVVLQYGPYWRDVQRIEFRSDDPYLPTDPPGTEHGAWNVTAGNEDIHGILDITQASFPKSSLSAGFSAFKDISKTIIHTTYRVETDTTMGNDDRWVPVELDSEGLTADAHAGHSATPLNHLIVRRRTATSDTIKFLVVWVLEWDPPAWVREVRPMVVQHLHRYFDNNLGGGEEEIDDITDPTPHAWLPGFKTIRDTSDASLMGISVNSDGTGAGTPRGHTDFQLTSTDNIRMVRSESGQEERQAVSVVLWPTVRHPSLPPSSEVSSPGSVEAQVSSPGSQRHDVSSPGSAASSASQPGSQCAELSMPGSAASQVRSL